MRGRKKKEDALIETIAIKITQKQKEIISKNAWIKKELIKQVRDYLNMYIT